jgi:ketohexokinase
VARILGIGIATLDIINSVEGYPAEDSEVRATHQRICRGGNATNTLVVLSQLGHRCAWAGVLADEPNARPILDDLARYSIDIQACRHLPHGRMPTSYILLNQRTGSRSIVHYRDLPEYRFADFCNIGLSGIDWLHFEGRNIDDTCRMLRHAHSHAPGITRSIEIEKPRPGIEQLFCHADLLLLSCHYAQSMGFTQPHELLQHVRRQAPQADLICAWGDTGAYGLTRTGDSLHSPAYPPPLLIDTLGAGDTFNAGIIHARLSGQHWAEALRFGCGIAGKKCGIMGLDRVASPFSNNPSPP